MVMYFFWNFVFKFWILTIVAHLQNLNATKWFVLIAVVDFFGFL